LFTVAGYFAVPLVFSWYSRLLLRLRAAKRRAIALTFDDGPGVRLTPAILKILAENNAKATFFLLGRNIAGREDIVRAIAEQGHEICSHGYNHSHYWKISPFQTIRDIKMGWRTIDSALGREERNYSFRPPYGKLNLLSLLYLLWNRVPVIYWTLDSGDTWDKNRPACLDMVKCLKQSAGAVLLFHDFERESLPEIEKYVIDCLSSILAVAKERGMSILTVAELAGRKMG
jgi:peptidoglycan-N-acetylglucosamine deacetylase